jgi:hypothetical protein
MTAAGYDTVGRRPTKGRSNPPRAPTFSRAETAARSLTVVPLTLTGSAVVAASTVRSWPAVVAMAIVLVASMVWVALGPTVSSWEVELPDGAIVRQHQLTFARRAPLPGLRPTHEGSFDTRAIPGSSAPSPSLRHAEPVPSTAEIRTWAREQGRVVSRYGPLSAEVRRAFDEAHLVTPMPSSPNEARRSIAGGSAGTNLRYSAMRAGCGAGAS